MNRIRTHAILRAACLCTVAVWGLGFRSASAKDMPMWGGTPSRNNVSSEKNLPAEWDVQTGKNIIWKAKLGSQSYVNAVIADGKVFVGSNNEAHYDPSYQEDAGCLICFRESDGKFLWQHLSPKLPAGRVNDWPDQGICSTPLVVGKRLYYCTSRCEVVCLDTDTGKEIWKLDMIANLGVYPHNMTSASPVMYTNQIFVITGNGVDESHKNVPAPQAPDFLALDKDSGSVLWKSDPIGKNILHGQWSSPTLYQNGGRTQVIFAGGDAWLYAYDADTHKLIWKFDCNEKGLPYPSILNEVIATPVLADGLIYIANGQDPEHGEGPGHLWRIDPSKAKGDVSLQLEAKDSNGKITGKPNPNSAVVWGYKQGPPPKQEGSEGGDNEPALMHRTIASCTVANGLCFANDFSGFTHCVDAKTGKPYWTYDHLSEIWGAPLVADGKVYIGTGDGDIRVFKLGKEMKLIAENNVGAAVDTTIVAANGRLYVESRNTLYAIGTKDGTGGVAKP